MFITSQTYQKYSGVVILGNSGRYCSDYKLQDKTEWGLIRTSLISSVSHFHLVLKFCLGAKPTKDPVAMGLNLGAPVSLGGKLADIFLIRMIAYSG